MVPAVLSDTFQSCVKSALCIASFQMSLADKLLGESHGQYRNTLSWQEKPQWEKGKQTLAQFSVPCTCLIVLTQWHTKVVCPMHIEVYHMMQTGVYQVIGPVKKKKKNLKMETP